MVLLNGAGVSAADPILKGLPGKIVFATSTFDVASITDTWIEGVNTMPGVSGSVKSSLSPAATVVTGGLTATYNDTTRAYTLASTAGLTIGDRLEMFQAALPLGLYEILTITGNDITLVVNPLLNQGNKTGISYQVAWSYAGTFGTAPIASNAAGQINYAKVRALDGVGAIGDAVDSFYVRDQPAGSGLITIGTGSYTGGSVSSQTPDFNLLSAWANRGGVSHVQLTDHSVQAVNTIRWGDTTITEKTIAAAITSGFSLTAGDGIKYGRLLLKSKTDGASLGIDIDVTLDTNGPAMFIALFGN